VKVEDEEREILRSVSLVQKRFVANNGRPVATRGCGFRNASLLQYRSELESAGFHVLKEHHDGRAENLFATMVVRKPPLPDPNRADKGKSLENARL
jgi:hypothetical protein